MRVSASACTTHRTTTSPARSATPSRARPGARGPLAVATLALAALLAAGLSAIPAAAWADGTLFGRLTAPTAAPEPVTEPEALEAPAAPAEPAAPAVPEPPSTDPGPAQSEVLQLNKTAFSCEAGQTRPLKVVASSVASDPATLTVTWSSSNTAVATVDGSGVVTAKAKGSVTISAATTVGGSSYVSECLVTVTNNRIVSNDPSKLQSAHDYADDASDVWVWHEEFSSGSQVVFDDRCALEEGFDFVELRGADDRLIGRYTGAELAGLSLWIEGDTFNVRLLSDGSGTGWGFAFASITPQFPDGWASNGTATYYYKDNGRLLGDQQIDGVWYWFDPEASGALKDKPADPAAPAAPAPETPTAPDVPMGVEDPADMGESFVKVPDFYGMQLWEARDLAWTLGLGCDDVWQYCDWAESGTVICQDVDAGTIVSPGAGVVVTVSAGPETVMMPDVCGIYWEDAKWQLEALGLIVDYYWDWAEGAGIDEVMWQSCAAGEQIAVGSNVTLAISAGPEPVYFTMPDYSYYWYQYPLEELTSWGATVVINDEIWAESEAEEGCVYWSDPAPGEPVAYGSIVTLYVTRFMDGTPVAAG